MAVGLRQQQAAQTAAALKAAAVRVFARQGYLNTKITDITAEADRAAGSFYSHFDNKEALLEALLADLLAEADVGTLEPGHGSDFRDRDAVRWHVATYWTFYRTHRAVTDALAQAASVDQTFARRAQQMTDPDLRHLAGHLTELDLPGDPLVVASLVSTLIGACASTWLGGTGPDLGRTIDDDEAIDTITTFIWHGVGGGQPPSPLLA